MAGEEVEMEREVRVRKKVNRHMCAMQGGVVGCTGVIAAYAVVLLQWLSLIHI